MGGSSSQTIGQRYFAKLTNFIGNPIDKLIGINFDNRGWIFKPNNDENFLRVESPSLYGDKEGGVAGFIDIHTGTADQLPNATYSADFPKVSGYPFQSYLLFRGLGKKPATTGGGGQITQGSPKHYNNSFYHGNSGYMKEMLLWPMRTRVRNDGRQQWYDVREDGKVVSEIGAFYLNDFMLNRNTKLIDSSSFKTFKINVFESGNVIDSSASYSIPNNSDFLFLADINSGIIGHPASNMHRSGELSLDVQNKLDGLVIVEFTFRSFAETTSNQLIGNLVYTISSEDVEISPGYPIKDKRIRCIMNASLSPKIGLNIEAKFPKSWGANTQACFFAATIRITKYEGEYDDVLSSGADINPIHKIREILTDDTAMNKPESDVNDSNFKKAADRIYTEGLGISWAVTEKSCIEAINELCGHIEAGVRINRQTGLYEMVLFRDDWFSEDQIHTLPVNKIKSMQLDGAVSADELINRLNVSYYNRDAIKNSSFSIAENAAIRNLNGYENSEEVKFPYFMNQRNAVIVAQWKLKQMSTPIWLGTFTTGFYEARKWNRYDLLRLAWPRKWAGTILVRIMRINLGTGTDVSIDFVEVVPYSSDLSSSIVIDTPVDTTPKPPQPALFQAFELSYLEAVQMNGQKSVDESLAYNPDAGYAAVIAKRPQNNSLNALMYTDTGNDYERAGVIVYSETAELGQNISQISTAFIVKDAGDIDIVSIGTQITVNNEIMVYQAYDEETSLLTVKRGALDTIPQNHLAGSILYFADDFITVDPTEYVTGEIINVKALTTTPSGILSIDDVDSQPVEIQARAMRPYPPANVKFNNAYYPETIVITNDIVLTWVHRNRLQQTGGEILGYYDGGVTLETGVTYSIEISADGTVLHHATEVNANSYVIPAAVLIQNKAHRLRIWTVRDSYTSFSVFEHSFFVESASLILTATVTEVNVSGNTVPTANISVNVDESLNANIQFDGSAIKGKADSGATITIEIEE